MVLAPGAGLPATPGFALAAALASALLTWAWIALARRRGIEDAPGQRRLHVERTPRGGGVAIGLVLLAAVGLLVHRAPADAGALPWLALGTGFAGFLLVGLVDDVAPLGVLPKFLGQWISAAVLSLGVVLAAPAAGGWLAFAALALAAVYLVNIWNFMDGSNGLVASQTLLVAGALAAWPGQAADVRLAGLALAAACLGFLPFNLPRARVFLGDAGSHVLGAGVFALAAISWRRGIVPLPALGLLGSAMLFDSGLTLAGRALRGRRIWRAHREHLYQYAVRSGHSHAVVCAFYAAWTLAAAGIAIVTCDTRSSFVVTISFILGLALATFVYVALRKRWLSARMRNGRAMGAGNE